MRECLYEARTRQGMTQRDVASSLGISEAYYCYIENAERQKTMDIALVAKLSDVLKIPVVDIVEMEKAEGRM